MYCSGTIFSFSRIDKYCLIKFWNKGPNDKNGIYPSNRTSSNIRNRNFKSKGLNGRMGNKVKEKYLKK